jgi:hypothetical protein
MKRISQIAAGMLLLFAAPLVSRVVWDSSPAQEASREPVRPVARAVIPPSHLQQAWRELLERLAVARVDVGRTMETLQRADV